jgi:hypothetical protein
MVEPTTHAYTVRLTGDDSGDWRLPLWKTHVTANRAVQVWGDWLLTLRGGLSANGNPDNTAEVDSSANKLITRHSDT